MSSKKNIKNIDFTKNEVRKNLFVDDGLDLEKFEKLIQQKKQPKTYEGALKGIETPEKIDIETFNKMFEERIKQEPLEELGKERDLECVGNSKFSDLCPIVKWDGKIIEDPSTCNVSNLAGYGKNKNKPTRKELAYNNLRSEIMNKYQSECNNIESFKKINEIVDKEIQERMRQEEEKNKELVMKYSHIYQDV
ncbi:MAG TPA: hypothetical protein V6C58_14235 [Allocoleopsis sp.]